MKTIKNRGTKRGEKVSIPIGNIQWLKFFTIKYLIIYSTRFGKKLFAECSEQKVVAFSTTSWTINSWTMMNPFSKITCLILSVKFPSIPSGFIIAKVLSLFKAMKLEDLKLLKKCKLHIDTDTNKLYNKRQLYTKINQIKKYYNSS